jgi:hypothetical protein
MSSASVEVACGGGQWPHQRISGLHEGGFFDIVEAELAGGDEHQTSHSISLLGCQHTVACVAEQVEGVGMQDFSAPMLIQAETGDRFDRMVAPPLTAHRAAPATVYQARPKANPGTRTDTHDRVRTDRVDEAGSVGDLPLWHLRVILAAYLSESDISPMHRRRLPRSTS